MKTTTHPVAALWAAATILLSVPRPAGAVPGDVLGAFDTPSPCVTGLVFDGTLLWVADHKTDRLYGLDRRGRVVESMPSPGWRPAGLAFDGKYLWNLDEVDRKIYRIDPKTGVTVHRLDSPVAAGRALAWDGSALWISDRKTRTLRRIDPKDGTTISVIPAPSRSVEGLAFDGRYLYATDRLADKIFMLEPRRGEVVFAMPSPGPYPTGIAFDGKDLLVADYQTDRIVRLVRKDQARMKRILKRREHVEFTYQVRNFGPNSLPNLTIYLAQPGKETSHRFLSPITYFGGRPRIVKEAPNRYIAVMSFSNIQPGRIVTVGWRAKAALYDVHYYVFPETIRSLGAVPASIRRRYLRNGTKYDIHSPVIRAAVRKALGKQRNPYWMARRLYRYVHRHMHYELAGGWNQAPRVLTRGSGSCSEYSFVFIALCRAAGIPARYVGSLVVRRDAASFDDVYHRWVEIYLPGYGWLPVDPSRGDKKTEADRGDAFSHVTADFIVTTRSRGPSRYLGWSYNAAARWTCKGRCRVEEENIAEWTPLRP